MRRCNNQLSPPTRGISTQTPTSSPSPSRHDVLCVSPILQASASPKSPNLTLNPHHDNAADLFSCIDYSARTSYVYAPSRRVRTLTDLEIHARTVSIRGLRSFCIMPASLYALQFSFWLGTRTQKGEPVNSKKLPHAYKRPHRLCTRRGHLHAQEGQLTSISSGGTSSETFELAGRRTIPQRNVNAASKRINPIFFCVSHDDCAIEGLYTNLRTESPLTRPSMLLTGSETMHVAEFFACKGKCHV
ncbi:uncharacterized protein LAESUDRAFT_756099 [Laetiporus sulphureus 93-53]|uniref:Uncharacterized protein n=1 Tax=Laetiporus sulphureus 93-53 TaxID=1314785 RepID=A0A165G613_9APHY|nr:uncharacterized protein LAESUDRAFT_756099 [Laetiporus sulphureus 93-53]KZT09874.1 hypothetical protein LAESUDRAFT_756099 [Laetiporus sulphureus 93-53]